MSNSKKLQLIQEATAAFPGTPVNSAIWYYLRNLYSDNGSVAGLISRYLSSDSTPPTPTIRWAYNFDGVDDRGQLQFRAINPDGDIDIEFKTGPTVNWGAVDRTVISQCLTATYGGGAGKEFTLYFNAVNGGLQGLLGGGYSTTAINAQLQPNSHYRWQLIGTALKVWFNRVLVLDTVFGRGTSREPSAVTVIGAQTHGNASTFRGISSGIFYDVRINGVLYPLNEANQTIQLPWPRRLGAELITRSVLENPNVQGSQWTYLGGGRWQLVGNGDLNDLRFFTNPQHPTAGLLEFEIESISGEIRCTSGSIARAVFNTIGVKRYFYTSIDEGGAGNAAVVFRRNVTGVPASCVIKNISLRPLWVASTTELVTNGGFSSSAGWTVGPYTTISGSACRIALATEATSTTRPVVVDGTKQYLLSYTVTEHSTGSVRVSLFANGRHYLGVDRITTGAYTELVTFNRSGGSFTNTIAVQGGYAGVSTAAITNISLREITSICNPLTLVNTASTGWQEINV